MLPIWLGNGLCSEYAPRQCQRTLPNFLLCCSLCPWLVTLLLASAWRWCPIRVNLVS